MLRSLFLVHATESHANGTRGDNDNPVALSPQVDCRANNESYDWEERVIALLVEN